MKKKITTKQMTTIALTTALICILGPLSIPLPFSPVPIAPCMFAIYLAAYVLNAKLGTASCCLYILIGLVGIPVFSKFTGGPQVLVGPTGGYIVGYIPLAFLTGLFIEKFEKKLYMHAVGMIIGLVICYALGTAWLAYEKSLSFSAALMAGVIPFIPGDIIKIVLAIIVGTPLRKALKKI